MTTMRELQERAGNPDLSHWKTRKMLSVSESALLTCGIDPLEFDHLADWPLCDELRAKRYVNWQHALMLIKSITEAICTQEIKSPYVVLEYPYQDDWRVEEQAKVSFSDEIYLRTTLTKIHREELFKWLCKNGYFEKQSSVVSVDLVMGKVTPIHSRSEDVLLLPAPTYTTPALEVVKAVVNHWWKDFDPDGNQEKLAPQQKHVKAWIAENHPEMNSDYIQTAIDKICRHPNAKAGGNKKRIG